MTDTENNNNPEDSHKSDLAAVCERLQGELDTLLDQQATSAGAESLDTAMSSFREVEQKNVSSIQLVALSCR